MLPWQEALCEGHWVWRQERQPGLDGLMQADTHELTAQERRVDQVAWAEAHPVEVQVVEQPRMHVVSPVEQVPAQEKKQLLIPAQLDFTGPSTVERSWATAPSAAEQVSPAHA